MLTEKLRAIMAIDPTASEISFNDHDYSWGIIAAAVDAIETALQALGLPREARVGILLRNRPGHVAAIVAVLASDRCLVTLNPVLPDGKLFTDLAALALPVVIGDAEDMARPGLTMALEKARSASISIGSRLEGVTAVNAREAGGMVATAPGVAIEMLTSGTTGAPKRVLLTRAAFDASFAGFTRYERGREFADAPRLRPGVTMVVNPLTHIGGIYGCIGALMAGRRIALLERFTVPDWVDVVRRHRPRVASAVPSAIRMILDANIPSVDLASLSALISGTAPLDPDLVDAFHTRYGIPILANYGATEFAGAVAGWTLDDFKANWTAKRGAAGRLHPDVKARIVDPATGEVLAPGAEGTLEVQGDQLGNGGGWLRTTDRAVLDADDFLFIRGRSDNAIIRGGFKVHPDEIVAALHQHPAVREAAVVGIADARLGAVPAAAIILRDGAAEPDLAAFLRDRLLPYQVPTRFSFVADFPRTPSMKPSAPELRTLFGDPG